VLDEIRIRLDHSIRKFFFKVTQIATLHETFLFLYDKIYFMAEQWNLYFWFEWVIVIFLMIYHVFLLFPPLKRPNLANIILVVPVLGLVSLLIISLVRPSFRWPLYFPLVLCLVDIAYVFFSLRKKKVAESSGTAAFFRLLGALGLLSLSLLGLFLVAFFPPPPVRSEIQVAMIRNNNWIRLARGEGGRLLRWRAEPLSVMEDYLEEWGIKKLEDGFQSQAPAVVVIAHHRLWNYRLLLEDLAQAGFDVWAYEGTFTEKKEEPTGWGPPFSWNWLRWPEFLSRLYDSIGAEWNAKPLPSGFLNARLQEIGSRLNMLRKVPQAIILIGQWENLERIRLSDGFQVLVRWGGSDLPNVGGRTQVLIVSPGLVTRPSSAKVAVLADGLKPMDISDHATLRPWLGLPFLGQLGPNASTRYASVREVTKRILQAVLWQGDQVLLKTAQIELPGGIMVLGSP
jgi:hypothetical protein